MDGCPAIVVVVPNRGAAIHRSGSFTSKLLANKVDMMVWDQVSMENVGSGSARCLNSCL